MNDDNDKTVSYRNMRARRERIWIYSIDDAYKHNIAWSLRKLDLQHEFLFTFQEEDLEFEYIMFSHGHNVFRVPVAIIKALKGE